MTSAPPVRRLAAAILLAVCMQRRCTAAANASVGLAIEPLLQALARLDSKSPVAIALTSEQWQQVALALRERAFFSAQVANKSILEELQAGVREALNPGADPAKSFMDRSKFVATMRQKLGAAPGDSGKMTDLTSERRLKLIYDFNKEDAAEYGRFATGSTPALLRVFPAQELVRIEERVQKRPWQAIWQEKGGQFFEGRMIAAKDAPIWTAISRFGRPWPPFDYGSGMGVRDVGRKEALRLGVIADGQAVQPPLALFTSALGGAAA